MFRIRMEVVLMLIVLFVVSVMTSPVYAQRGQCNVGQSNSQVNTAAVLQSLAQQQVAVAPPRAIVAAPVRSATAIAAAPSILAVPPPVTVLATPQVATAQATSAVVAQQRRFKFLPPKQVAITRANGTSIAVNRQ